MGHLASKGFSFFFIMGGTIYMDTLDGFYLRNISKKELSYGRELFQLTNTTMTVLRPSQGTKQH